MMPAVSPAIDSGRVHFLRCLVDQLRLTADELQAEHMLRAFRLRIRADELQESVRRLQPVSELLTLGDDMLPGFCPVHDVDGMQVLAT